MKTLQKNVLPQGHGHHVGVGQKEDLPLLWLVSLEVITNVLRAEKMSAGISITRLQASLIAFIEALKAPRITP